LSTDHLPARDSAEILRETYGRTVLRAEIEPLGDEPCRFDMTLFAMPGLGVASGACSPLHVHRTPELIDNDDLVLLVALDGGTVMKHRGREELIDGGRALLMSNDEVGLNRMQSSFRCLNLSMSRTLLAPLIGDLSTILMQPIRPDIEALRLLASYVGAVEEMPATATPELRHRVVAHIYDLTALAVGATRDTAEIARARGVRAARLRAIKADIAGNAGAQHLSPESIARRHRLSERYVRKLFEMEGMSLTEFMLGQRLARAHGMLTDRRLAGRTITEIALEAGFNDLSYFNRTFRRRYSATPSDVRAARKDN
jgi:AraC-like DNA-binding protein